MTTKITTSGTSGLSLSTVLFLIFMTLKLTGNIAWSWWWVAAPLWIPIGIALAVLVVVGTAEMFSFMKNTNRHQ